LEDAGKNQTCDQHEAAQLDSPAQGHRKAIAPPIEQPPSTTPPGLVEFVMQNVFFNIAAEAHQSGLAYDGVVGVWKKVQMRVRAERQLPQESRPSIPSPGTSTNAGKIGIGALIGRGARHERLQRSESGDCPACKRRWVFFQAGQRRQ